MKITSTKKIEIIIGNVFVLFSLYDKCDPMSECCTADHLWVGLSPVSLFVWTSYAQVVLLDPQENQQRVMEELARTPLSPSQLFHDSSMTLSSGWVHKESNSPVLLTPSITQNCLLIGVNKTKPLVIIQ